MASDKISIDLDKNSAEKMAESWADESDTASKRAVQALTVLAEGPMKAEAPEGTGQNPPSLRDSIDTKPTGLSKSKVVMPFKRTNSGWLLVRAIVGKPSAPSYDDKRPPVDPLIEWARQKLGDPGLGWYLQDKIYREGHETLPNRFVDRSMREWENEAEEVAGEAFRQAFE